MNVTCPVCKSVSLYVMGAPSGCTEQCRSTLDVRAATPSRPAIAVGQRVAVTRPASSFHAYHGVVDEVFADGTVNVCLPSVGTLRFAAGDLEPLP